MAKKWAEVVKNPAYQKLSPESKEAARNQYFDEVVVPQISPDQIDAARRQFDSQTGSAEQKTKSNYDEVNEETSGLGKFGAGIGGGLYGAYLGVKQAAANVGNKVGLVDDKTISGIKSDVTDFRDAQNALNRTGAGFAGNVVGSAAALAPTAFIPGANTVTGAAVIGGLSGGLMTPGDLKDRALAATTGAIAGAGSQYVGQKAGNYLANRATQKATQANLNQSTNALRDSTLQASQAAGYVVPPTQANPTLLNRAAEGFAGKISTAQLASSKNQAVTNDLAKKSLGIMNDQPITPKVLEDIRANAGQAYEAIAQIPQPLKSNASYTRAINQLGDDWSNAAQQFPDLVKNDQITTLISSLKQKEINPAAAVEVVKKLRFDAKANLKAADDPAKLALGKAQRSAAEAVENLIDSNLNSAAWRFELAKQARLNGLPYQDTRPLVENLKNARQLIAKSYDIEAALNESTGNVSAQYLAKLLDKGKPLTGELKTAAEFARTFPKAAQDLEKMGSLPGLSPLDYGTAGLGLMTSGGNPLAIAGLAARPGARSAILSKPYQNALLTPNYSVNPVNALAAKAANSQIGQNALRVYPTAAGIIYGQEQ